MMMNIPQITEADIRPLATDQSWSRGEDYYYSYQVGSIFWRDGLLIAEVEGSKYEPYVVQVEFVGNQIRFTDCTCPYDWDGDCKHIIAALLYLCYRRNDIEQRPSVKELIAKLNRVQLIELITDLSYLHPAIIDDIEQNTSSDSYSS
jgi:uncharacterized Zn finger protein